ncbi:MAG: group I intron-associated PD-(D/E)XK endonuclease [Actinomycetota bacterium]
MSGSKLRLPKPKLTNHPVDVGQRTEAAILSELVRRGYSVLLPFGVNQRYDLVLELGERLLRVQCKTGRRRGGCIEFSTVSVLSNRAGWFKRDYAGEADLFLVYWPENDRIYAVPVEEAPRSHMSLRVDPPLNGQKRRIKFASDYELPA